MIRFNMRRLLVCLTLIMCGLIAVPICLSINVRNIPAGWVNIYRVTALLWFFVLPMAGVGYLARQTFLFSLLGIFGAIGVFVLALD